MSSQTWYTNIKPYIFALLLAQSTTLSHLNFDTVWVQFEACTCRKKQTTDLSRTKTAIGDVPYPCSNSLATVPI